MDTDGAVIDSFEHRDIYYTFVPRIALLKFQYR